MGKESIILSEQSNQESIKLKDADGNIINPATVESLTKEDYPNKDIHGIMDRLLYQASSGGGSPRSLYDLYTKLQSDSTNISRTAPPLYCQTYDIPMPLADTIYSQIMSGNTKEVQAILWDASPFLIEFCQGTPHPQGTRKIHVPANTIYKARVFFSTATAVHFESPTAGLTMTIQMFYN